MAVDIKVGEARAVRGVLSAPRDGQLRAIFLKHGHL
jgi:hypothetical protein